jgi:DNA modification methylase
MKIYKRYSESNKITLYNGDCAKLLKKIPDETVDLIITSPPIVLVKHMKIRIMILIHSDDSIFRFFQTYTEL